MRERKNDCLWVYLRNKVTVRILWVRNAKFLKTVFMNFEL